MIRIFIKAVAPLSLTFLLVLGHWSQGFAQDTIRTYYDDESRLLKEIYIRVNGKAEGII